MIRPTLAFLLVLSLLPTCLRAAGLEVVTIGEQVFKGVLVKAEGGRFLLLKNAGTTQEVSYVARAAHGDPEIQKTLESLAVPRQAIPLTPEVEMQRRGGLFVPVPVERKLYPESAYREYLGNMTAEGEFHIKRIVAKDDVPHVEKVLPMARNACREIVKESGKPELDMAFTLLEKTGLLDRMLRAVAPILKDPAR